MAEINSYKKEEIAQGLKSADSTKTKKDNAAGVGLRAELFGGKKASDRAISSDIKVKKRLPVVVDLIAGLLMLVLVLAVIVGSYVLFRYYSNDYDSARVEYKVTVNVSGKLDTYDALKDGELFMDVTGNSVYFGKIKSVEIIENEDGDGGRVILTVSASVKHRDGEGYSIGSSRLAVGSKYSSLRCGEINLKDALVTALSVEGK